MPVHKNRISIMGCAQPQGGTVIICCISIEEFRSIEHGKKPLAVRRWSLPWEDSALVTSGVSHNLDFCAVTSRYRLRKRAPSTVAIMAIDKCGLSCDVKGVSSPTQGSQRCQWESPWVHGLDLPAFQSVVTKMVHRKRLCHSYHPCHVDWGGQI